MLLIVLEDPGINRQYRIDGLICFFLIRQDPIYMNLWHLNRAADFTIAVRSMLVFRTLNSQMN